LRRPSATLAVSRNSATRSMTTSGWKTLERGGGPEADFWSDFLFSRHPRMETGEIGFGRSFRYHSAIVIMSFGPNDPLSEIRPAHARWS
jgi:hypothetical protein